MHWERRGPCNPIPFRILSGRKQSFFLAHTRPRSLSQYLDRRGGNRRFSRSPALAKVDSICWSTSMYFVHSVTRVHVITCSMPRKKCHALVVSVRPLRIAQHASNSAQKQTEALLFGQSVVQPRSRIETEIPGTRLASSMPCCVGVSRSDGFPGRIRSSPCPSRHAYNGCI